MSDSWIDKTENEIRDDIVAIAKEETGLTNFKSTGVLRSFIEVIARVVAFIYNSAINMIYKNATLSGATGIFLTLWGLKLGVARKQETKASGSFTGTAYGDGSIPAGTWAVVPGTDLRFKVVADVNFAEGDPFSIPVEAEFPGVSHNVGAGTAIRLTKVVTGLDSVSVGEDWIDSLGTETEEDDLYRKRIESRWRSQILGDIKEVYKLCAESVDGVRAAHIVRAPRGPGSTDVVIASVIGLPNEELIKAVEDALHDRELMAFDVRVCAPGVEAIDIEIEFSGDATEEAVKRVAERYVHDLGIGTRFAVRGLYKAYRTLKLPIVEIISPARDVQPNGRSVIVAAVRATKVFR